MMSHENINTFNGIPVIKSVLVPERQPKFCLKSGSYVSEECRRDFNDFLIKNFGYETCVIMTKDAIYIHPNNIRRLEKLLIKNSNDMVSSVDIADLIARKDFRNNAPVYPLFQILNAAVS